MISKLLDKILHWYVGLYRDIKIDKKDIWKYY